MTPILNEILRKTLLSVYLCICVYIHIYIWYVYGGSLAHENFRSFGGGGGGMYVGGCQKLWSLFWVPNIIRHLLFKVPKKGP